MSITVTKNGEGVKNCYRYSCLSMVDLQEKGGGREIVEDRGEMMMMMKEYLGDDGVGFDSSGCSSFGKNSDDDDFEEEEDEIQSSDKCGSFGSIPSMLEALPTSKGISRHYNGKSKSYTSLADALSLSSSINDIAKPDNAYSRRQRNKVGEIYL